jgi:membrane-associated protein
MLARILAAGGALDPKELIEKVGLVGIWIVVFAESGLLIGFFLPGDSLLFTAGFFASAPSSVNEALHLPLVPLVVGCFVAAVVGDQVGYLFGRRVGPALFRRPNSRFFRRENVDKAQAFFDKHGSKTIVLARFVPVVRTFAPIVAGVSRMHYRTFVMFNVIGGFLWAVGVTLLGYFLGQIEVVEENLEIAILTIVVVSVMPIALEVIKARREGRSATADVATAADLTGELLDDDDHDLTTPPRPVDATDG